MSSSEEIAREAEVVNKSTLRPSVPPPPRDGDCSWPRTREEWKQLAVKAAPWIAGAAIVVLGVTAYQRSKEEPGGVWARKRKHDAQSAWGDAQSNARKSWFSFRSGADDAAKDAVAAGKDAKAAAAAKAAQAKSAARDAGSQAREYVSDRAQELKEATKSAAARAEAAAKSAGSRAGAAISAAEEAAGAKLAAAGNVLEKDGSETRKFFKGKEAEAKPWYQFW